MRERRKERREGRRKKRDTGRETQKSENARLDSEKLRFRVRSRILVNSARQARKFPRVSRSSSPREEDSWTVVVYSFTFWGWRCERVHNAPGASKRNPGHHRSGSNFLRQARGVCRARERSAPSPLRKERLSARRNRLDRIAGSARVHYLIGGKRLPPPPQSSGLAFIFEGLLFLEGLPSTLGEGSLC